MAFIEARPKYNTSLGYVKDTYIGEMTSDSVNKLSQISKMKLARLEASAIKLRGGNKHFLGGHKYSHSLNKNSYGDIHQGLFKQKLAMLKESVTKDYEKDLIKIRHQRKEFEYTIDYTKTPVNFDYPLLPKLNTHAEIRLEQNASKHILDKISTQKIAISYPKPIIKEMNEENIIEISANSDLL